MCFESWRVFNTIYCWKDMRSWFRRRSRNSAAVPRRSGSGNGRSSTAASSSSSIKSSTLSPKRMQRLCKITADSMIFAESLGSFKRRVVLRAENLFLMTPKALSTTFRVLMWETLKRPFAPSGSPGKGVMSHWRSGYAESPRITAPSNGRFPASSNDLHNRLSLSTFASWHLPGWSRFR